jgi:hypothetical protein
VDKCTDEFAAAKRYRASLDRARNLCTGTFLHDMVELFLVNERESRVKKLVEVSRLRAAFMILHVDDQDELIMKALEPFADRGEAALKKLLVAIAEGGNVSNCVEVLRQMSKSRVFEGRRVDDGGLHDSGLALLRYYVVRYFAEGQSETWHLVQASLAYEALGKEASRAKNTAIDSGRSSQTPPVTAAQPARSPLEEDDAEKRQVSTPSDK